MSKGTLKELFPNEIKVKFEKIDKELTLNKISLADDAWMLQEFGGKQELVAIFNNSDYRAMIRIFYRLLCNEDKKFFTDMIKINTIDEDGEETEITSNVDKILFLLEKKDLEKLAPALIKTRGVSLPILTEEELAAESDSEASGKKKKLKK